MKRSFKVLSLDCCTLCVANGESIDHPFLHCLMTIELWHKFFRLTNRSPFLLRAWGARIGQSHMANRLSYFDFDSIARKKCKNLLGQLEDNLNITRPSIFLFIILGIYNYSFQGHSSQLYSTQLDFDM